MPSLLSLLSNGQARGPTGGPGLGPHTHRSTGGDDTAAWNRSSEIRVKRLLMWTVGHLL